MDLGEGMVAVVRGLPDSGLALTLVEGGRQYTLLPNSAIQNFEPSVATYAQFNPAPPQVQSASTETCPDIRVQQGAARHSSTQAVDGNYASVYKVAHCKVKPTSPPFTLTEFPPQRAELCRGQGNFEVGGLGSGEITHTFTKANGSYRGAMVWPDRGAVCTPRAMTEHDPFAHSLRRYPNLSPQKSAELIERLVNYTQTRNHYSPAKSRSPASAGRSVPNNQGHEGRGCMPTPRSQKAYEPEVIIKPKTADESPTQDICKKIDFESEDYKKSPFGKTYDVCHVRERRFKDNVKTVPIPCSHIACPTIEEGCDLSWFENKMPELLNVTDSIHKETQAQTPMISREVATVPRAQPSTRNVAVSLSLSSSHLESSKLHHHRKVQAKCSCKSIQTSKPVELSLQTCISSVDVNRENKKKAQNCRKSKSQEELRVSDDIEQEIIHLIKKLGTSADSNTDYNIRNELLNKIKKIHNTEQYKLKFGRYIRDQLYPQMDLKMFTKELSNELISTIKANNMVLGNLNPTNNIKDNIGPNKGNNEDQINYVDELIKDWLGNIPIKSLDYLGRQVKKDQVIQKIAVEIKSLIMNKVTNGCDTSLKPKLFDILEDIPIEVNSSNKMYYLKMIVDDLVKKIENVCSVNARGRKQWKKTVKNHFKKELIAFRHFEPTENELKQFVKQEIRDFLTKFHLKIRPTVEEQIQVELVDILINSIEKIRRGKDDQIKEEILIVLTDVIGTTELEGIYFVNHLTYRLKNMLNESLLDNIQQSFIILQNSVQNTNKHTQNHSADFSIEGISDQDILKNLDLYTKQIVQQINEWMKNIQGMRGIDTGFKKVVAQDLADDIVDRHKYLELNPNSKGTDADELEHLKYQIFKWVNKLVGEDNLDTIAQASELMERIQNIPVPMLTRPIHNVDTSRPPNLEQNVGATSTGRDLVKDSSPSPRMKTKCHCSRNEPSERLGSPKKITERDNSPDASPDEFAHKCVQAPTKNFGVMTNPNENPKRVAFTETEMPQILKTRPRGTSMSIMRPPRDESRRFSGPAGFPSGYMNAGGSPDRVGPQPYCNSKEPTTATTSVKQLSDEFDQYLQNWVQQIPIITSKPEEQALIEKMRLGIYNGVWKALTKLHMNPTTLDNPFYYQDVLDDEVEELLDLLPQSKELTNQKQTLKCRLIEKTINMNQQIFDTTASSSYKQQLVDNITNNLPRKNLGMVGSDVMKICEEILKLNLAEDYIMAVMYREVHQVKANVYKKKLMKHMQEFFDVMKSTYGIEAKDIPLKSYRDEIMTALAKVPMPSDDTIRKEGDEILIGLEIEHWFSDLPLFPAENRVEMLCRKRYIENLAKKIHVMEMQSNLNNCEDELRHEIKRFMGKLPLKPGDTENTPFMIEELVNRLKNRPKDIVAGSGKSFLMDPNNYDEFSRDMPLCSSFSEAPDAKRAQINESSYYIVGGERANTPGAFEGQCVQNRGNLQDPESQIEWLTMLPDSAQQVPKELFQGQSLQSAQASESRRKSVQASGQMMSPGPAPSQKRDSQHSTCSQSCAPSQKIRDETSGGQPARDLSYQQPMAESTQRRPSLRPEQSMNMSKGKSHISGPFPEHTCQPGNFTDQRQPTAKFTGTQDSQKCSKSYSPRRSVGPAGTNGFRPEVCSRICEENQDEPQTTRRHSERHYTQSPSDFFGQPMGFSTPQHKVTPPRESRPKKRKTREVSRSGREAARRKLSLSDSDDSVKEEVRCRCMERIWKCKKKSSLSWPCEECSMDFPPCFSMGCPPYPFYF